MSISLCTKNRTQKAPAGAGTASILYALPEVPASVPAFTRRDELPDRCTVEATAKSLLQSPGPALARYTAPAGRPALSKPEQNVALGAQGGTATPPSSP